MTNTQTGDLDIFTRAELEAQVDLHYHDGQRLYESARATGDRAAMSAAMDQFELQGAACLELARRFAEIPGSMGTGNVNDDAEESPDA